MHKCCDKLVVNEGLMSDSLNNEGHILGWLPDYFRREKSRSESIGSAKPPEDSAGCLGEARPECEI